MALDGSPGNGHRIVLDRHISVGAIATVISLVVSSAVAIGGGFWAVGQMRGELSGLRNEIAGVRQDVKDGIAGVRQDLVQRSIEFNARINAQSDRIDRIQDGQRGGSRP